MVFDLLEIAVMTNNKKGSYKVGGNALLAKQRLCPEGREKG
jgi:hypothetical protein